MAMPSEELMKKYRWTKETFEKAGISWGELQEIQKDHEDRTPDLLDTGTMISAKLRRIPEVHSLRVRVKDPEHLMEKVLRKSNSERRINLENYRQEITDLVGVRALHLFKDDWLKIHQKIQGMWDLAEKPVANIRDGDSEANYEEHGCKIETRDGGYRSVHYLTQSSQTKEQIVTEIQVRTIFEEGWSEIDHQMRYPYDTDNELLNRYLAILNRLAGSADEMGTFIRWLMDQWKVREKLIEETQRDLAQQQVALKELREQFTKLNQKNERNPKAEDAFEKLESGIGRSYITSVAFRNIVSEISKSSAITRNLSDYIIENSAFNSVKSWPKLDGILKPKDDSQAENTDLPQSSE